MNVMNEQIIELAKVLNLKYLDKHYAITAKEQLSYT